MAEPSKSKNPSEDAVTYGATSSFEEDDEAKTDKKLASKRRKVHISSTSSEDSRSQALEVVVSNEDLLPEIFYLVPVRSLLKFLCVSKQWYSLITDWKFASNHSRKNPCSSLISGIYFYRKPLELSKPLELTSVSLHGQLSLPSLAFLDPVQNGSKPKMVDSCNGLMLFSYWDETHYVVCNPTTQKYIALPEPGHSPPYGLLFGAHLAFDPSKSPYYKVLLISHHSSYKSSIFERTDFYLIRIFSSKTASWKEIHAKAPRGRTFLYEHRVFWNGALHWMNEANVHIRFDIDAENFTRTTMPKVPNILPAEKTRFFGECGGSLLLIQTREYNPLRFRILEMEKDCCRWIVKYRVNMRMLVRSAFLDECSLDYTVLCCANGPDEKDDVLVLLIDGKVIAYSLNLKSCKVLLDLQCDRKNPGYHSYHLTYRFTESLSPVGSSTRC